MSEQPQLDWIRTRTVVLRLPETAAVSVRRGVEYEAGAQGAEPLVLDLYYPPHHEGRAGLPVLVFVVGYPDPGMQRILGCRAKEMGQYTSWARLAAASGMAAVTYSTRAPAEDIGAVLRHLRRNATALGLDASRIALWSCSGNVPNALATLMQEEPGAVRCAVLAYGLMLDADGSTVVADAARTFGFANAAAGRRAADLPRSTPLLVVRAGSDEFPGLDTTIDRFTADALALDLPLTLINHAGAPHAFDVIVDDEATREVIRRMLAFLRFHLAE